MPTPKLNGRSPKKEKEKERILWFCSADGMMEVEQQYVK
jgi:hypothetical protein